MKRKCIVCGKRFMPQMENVYRVIDQVPPLKVITDVSHVYDAIDCPRCGCQVKLNIRLPGERIAENGIESIG